ncbi:alpha-mannosidase [Sparassis latifolia]
MRWPTYWPRVVLLLLIIGLEGHRWSYNHAAGLAEGAEWTTARKLDARERTRNLWYHGFDNYMRYGRGPDWHNPGNIASNDVAGNFSVTLVDTLDTFVVLNDRPGFEAAVRNVIDYVSFDIDTKPQVFETTIRVLGGLLSGHLFARQTGQPFYLPWYHDELLSMARDLGERLLPAFATPTGIPYARLNLRHGIPRGESVETCTAGAGSLILEFGTLSRLTGDPRFEKAAYKAFFALWNRKSDIGLVGNTIHLWTGSWIQPEISSIGAGIDSFYEYALKWYILSGEVEFLDVWQESYAAVMRYARAPDGFSGDMAYSTFDSLSSFWPGLQVLAGDIENAIKSHLTYWNVWKTLSGLPEVWDMSFRQATSFQYPLRPEFVESTWYLYRVKRILYDITTRAKVLCGLTGIQDLRTNARDDRMESFVLSETLKYLYLLFDEANPIHSDDSNYVLTTEGHILRLSRDMLKPMSSARRKLRGVEHPQCPAYQPPLLAYDDWNAESGIIGGIRSRADMDYARQLIGTRPSDSEIKARSPGGWCARPKYSLYSFDFILSPKGEVVPEDEHPSVKKVMTVTDGYLLQNVTGIRAHIVSRLDGKGYDVTKLGPYAVKTGQLVYVNDPELILTPVDDKASQGHPRVPEVELRFFVDRVDPLFHLQPHGAPTEIFVTASTALFGGDPTIQPPPSEAAPPFGRGAGVPIIRDPANPLGCQPYSRQFSDHAVVVQRGDCTFLEKLVLAKAAGASGVVVLNDEDSNINPSTGQSELELVGDAVDDAVIVVLRQSVAKVVTDLMDATDGYGQLMVAIEPEGQFVTESTSRDPNRVLYLNGHPLLNTRLLV